MIEAGAPLFFGQFKFDQPSLAVGALDGPLVGPKVARDHCVILANLIGGALCDHDAALKAVHPIADTHDEGHVMFDNDHGSIKLLLDALDQRAEGLGLSSASQCFNRW